MRKSWLSTLALSLGWIGSTTAFGQYPNAYNNFGPSSFPVTQQPPSASVLQSLPQVPHYKDIDAPQSAQPQAGNPAQYGTPVSQSNRIHGGSTPQYGITPHYGITAQPGNTAQYGQPVPYPQSSPYQLVGMQDGNANGTYSIPAGGGVQPLNQPLSQPSAPAAPQIYQQQPLAMPNEFSPSAGQPYQAPVDYGYQQAVAPNCNSCGPAPVSGVATVGGGHAAGTGHRLGFGGGLPCGAKPWFFGANALIFQRSDNHDVPLSLLDSSYDTDVLTTQSARMGTTGGFEASVGRYFNCGKNAIQATYWGLYPSEQTVLRVGMAGDFSSRLPLGLLQMSGTPAAPGVPYTVGNWFEDARAHELRRSSNYHNVEVNLLGFAAGGAARNFNMSTAGTLFSGHGGGHGSSCGYCGGAGCGSCGGNSAKFATGPCCLIPPVCSSRLNLTWLGGFRYFHFSDNLQYAASLDDDVINRGADDLYYNVDTTNNLFGFQLGSRADYCVTRLVNLYGVTKVGIYNNHSRLLTRVGTDGEDAVLNDTRPIANPNNGGAYDFDESKDDIAFLSEIGSGVGVRLSPKWTGTVGYRAIIVSGVATSPDNVRQSFANFNDIADYNNDSTLILHGLNIGALYNY